MEIDQTIKWFIIGIPWAIGVGWFLSKAAYPLGTIGGLITLTIITIGLYYGIKEKKAIV